MGLPSVSGRYRGSREGIEVELRVDVDGARPTMRVSADYFELSGGQPQYRRSMRIDAPRVTHSATHTAIVGMARFSRGAPRKVTVTIPRGARAGAPATLHHHGSDGRWSFVCVCAFEDARFRRIEFEEARERGIDPPAPYDTAALPSRARARTLSTIAAYDEAGIELRSGGEPQIIETRGAGADAAWSDAELHAAMQQHFTRFADRPQWAIWLLHAANHTNPKLSGIMFDTLGRQRQGCAVFYGHDPATTDFLRRARLYNCVHELGHAFNLRHCWERTLDSPPIPARPQSATWMNYPERDRRGPPGFFERFDFVFDDPEVVHLRHAFRESVIPGGNPFTGRPPSAASRSRLSPAVGLAGAVGAAGATARSDDGDWSADRQDPALRLRLSAPAALPLNFPVTAQLELSTTASEGRIAPTTLDPRAGTVDIAIRRPGGADVLFEPLLRHCRGADLAVLRAGEDVLRDVALIHYGTNGFAFDEPGIYQLRARYTAPDGRIALSQLVRLRVQPLVSRSDRGVADLVSGNDEVGTLLALMGSRAPELARGNAKLQSVIETYPAHPRAAVARLVRGVGLARAFKTIGPRGEVLTQPERAAEAFALINAVIDLAVPLRAAARAHGEEAKQRAFAAALSRVGTRRGVSPLVAPFVSSRLSELATVHAGLARGRPASRRPLEPRRRVVDSPEGTGAVQAPERPPPKTS